MAAVRRLAIALAAGFALGLAFSAAAVERGGAVRVAGRADGADPAALDAFTRETGLRLVLDTFEDEAALSAALGEGRYDVAQLSARAVATAAAKGALAPLDALAPPPSGLDPALTAMLGANARFAMPYLWSPLGLAFDPAAVARRAPAGAPDGWEALLRPASLRALGDCGVGLPQDGPRMATLAALALKLDPRALRAQDQRRILGLLHELRPLTRLVGTPAELISSLASGEICLAVLGRGQAGRAIRRAGEAQEPLGLFFALPKEGGPAGLDVLVEPARAPHPGAAAAFLAFMTRPDMAARNVARTRFTAAVPAAKALSAPDLAEDPTLYPDPAMTRRFFLTPELDGAFAAQVAREWGRAKAGK